MLYSLLYSLLNMNKIYRALYILNITNSIVLGYKENDNHNHIRCTAYGLTSLSIMTLLKKPAIIATNIATCIALLVK